MMQTSKNIEKRKEIADNAIKRAKVFSIENIGKQWKKLFKELLEN